MRAFASIVALVAGITFGGAFHLLLMSDAVLVRLQQRGIDTFAWCCKTPGEEMAFYIVFSLLACSVPFVAGLLLAASALTERRISGGGRAPRWRFADLIPPRAWALLGVALAAGRNLLVVEHDYRSAAASPGSFAAGTIAVGLPAMRDFTPRFLLVVAALALVLALVAPLARRCGSSTVIRPESSAEGG